MSMRDVTQVIAGCFGFLATHRERSRERSFDRAEGEQPLAHHGEIRPLSPDEVRTIHAMVHPLG